MEKSPCRLYLPCILTGKKIRTVTLSICEKQVLSVFAFSVPKRHTLFA